MAIPIPRASKGKIVRALKNARPWIISKASSAFDFQDALVALISRLRGDGERRMLWKSIRGMITANGNVYLEFWEFSKCYFFIFGYFIFRIIHIFKFFEVCIYICSALNQEWKRSFCIERPKILFFVPINFKYCCYYYYYWMAMHSKFQIHVPIFHTYDAVHSFVVQLEVYLVLIKIVYYSATW